MKSLVLIGGGGHCSAVADIAHSMATPIAGLLSKEDSAPLGLLRLGGDEWLDQPQARNHQFLVVVGQIKVSPLRERLFDALTKRGLEAATIIAPDAICSNHSQIGVGTVLMRRAVAGPSTSIGRNCIINTGAIIEHDAVVGDHSHVSTGAILNGGVRIGSGVLVGSGAIVLQQISICDDVVIGAGSVVNREINQPGTYVGVPAKRIA